MAMDKSDHRSITSVLHILLVKIVDRFLYYGTREDKLHWSRPSLWKINSH